MNGPDNLEIELERTFLAKFIPSEVQAASPVKMLDIYVPEDADRPYIRLRQRGEAFEITKKKPISQNDFSRQTEQTIPLEADEFEALARSSTRTVEKNRYKITIDGTCAEVDVFSGELEGLVLLDFEFEDAEAKQSFQPPECCLAEVTQELFVAGGQLAGKTYEDIRLELGKFNYEQLTL